MLRALALLLALAAPARPRAEQGCPSDPQRAAACLRRAGRLAPAALARLDSAVFALVRRRDSLLRVPSAEGREGAAEAARALARLGDLASRDLLGDTARANRLIDHLLVTEDYLAGRLEALPGREGQYRSMRTPGLVWVHYARTGIFFQPVSTVQARFLYLPGSGIATDTLARLAEALHRYAMRRQAAGRRFVVWEYLFPYQTSGTFLQPPWHSSMAEGKVLAIDAELLRRTGDRRWRARADSIVAGFAVPWDSGGSLLADTSHGYWFEMYDPADRVWNGSVYALVALGDHAHASGDTLATRLYGRGVEAVKQWTPLYDTGSWTFYSLTQGLNSRAYHATHVELARLLFAQTGDPWFRDLADRWAAYQPPPGVR